MRESYIAILLKVLAFLNFNFTLNINGHRAYLDGNLFSTNNKNNVFFFQQITFFLFFSLNNKKFKSIFHDSWPCKSSSEANKFLNHTMKWLNEIKREDDEVWSSVPLRRSVLADPRSDLAAKVMACFSVSVLKMLIKRKGK